ncbi:MAG: DUF5615 family PIN-like protein [Bryobacteraceae bacterium]
MRILLDENLPSDLAAELDGHRAHTVAHAGWSGTPDGKLLRLAAAHYDAFLTMDGSIRHQQNYSNLGLRIVVIKAQSNRLFHLRPLVPQILKTLRWMRPGQLVDISSQVGD